MNNNRRDVVVGFLIALFVAYAVIGAACAMLTADKHPDVSHQFEEPEPYPIPPFTR